MELPSGVIKEYKIDYSVCKNNVKHWMTFNEINMILHLPFVGGGIVFKEGEDKTKIMYQAAHHQLVASALATKAAHEIIPNAMVGCMLAAGVTYPYTCNPEDVKEAIDKNRENYFFIDVHQGENILDMLKGFLEKII